MSNLWETKLLELSEFQVRWWMLAGLVFLMNLTKARHVHDTTYCRRSCWIFFRGMINGEENKFELMLMNRTVSREANRRLFMLSMSLNSPRGKP